MKTLLAFFYNHFDFLYLNTKYRITDSSTDGVATNNASLRLTGPSASFWLSNDRGQISCDVAPTKADSPKNWFRITIVRQFLDGFEETKVVPREETAGWIRDNLSRIEALFANDTVSNSCEKISALEKAMADKYFGPAQPSN
jgi:hypothetical protein